MKKSLSSVTRWTAFSTLIKIGAGLFVIKWIALIYGSEGVGQAANYMTLLTVLSVFAGSGIFNGVTKYVAEYETQPLQLAEMLGCSTWIIISFSLLLALLGLLFAAPLSLFIFSSENYQHEIRLLSLIQFIIAGANYALAILKGKSEAKGFALSVIGGTLIGVLVFMLLNATYQYKGALIGLALIPAAILIPSYRQLQKCGQNQPDFLLLLKPRWNLRQAKKLLPFALMVFSTVITLPPAYMLMRNWLAEAYGMADVGLWQGVSKISDAYLQFILAAFSVYLLPTFAKLKHRHAIVKEVWNTLRFILPLTIIVGIIIYIGRKLIVCLLFSAEFSAMEALFLWQLVGDWFKVATYVFGYLLVAKAMLRVYILAEVLQAVLLLGTAAYCIPTGGALGAVQSYMISYILYFGICLMVFVIYQRRGI